MARPMSARQSLATENTDSAASSTRRISGTVDPSRGSESINRISMPTVVLPSPWCRIEVVPRTFRAETLVRLRAGLGQLRLGSPRPHATGHDPLGDERQERYRAGQQHQ